LRRRRIALLIADSPQPGSIAEAYSATAPFAELRGNVFRYKDDARGSTDQFTFGGTWLRLDQRQDRATVGRRNTNQPLAGMKTGIEG
jgi:hypothetical protein